MFKKLNQYKADSLDFIDDKLESPKKKVAKFWHTVYLVVDVLFIIRFSLIVVIAVTAFVFSDQGQEVLIAMGETNGVGMIPSVDGFIFLLATMLCAFVVWYAARIMFLFDFKTPASDKEFKKELKLRLPRQLGVSVLVIVVIALLKAAIKSPNTSSLAVLLIVIAIVFFIGVERKNDIFGVNKLVEDHSGSNSFKDLPGYVRRIFYILLAANVVSLILFTHFPHETIKLLSLNAASLFFLALSLIAVTGNVLVYYGNQYHRPVIFLLILWVAGVSYINDNHKVRQEADMRSYDEFKSLVASSKNENKLTSYKPGSSPLKEYFKNWMDKNHENKPETPVPVFIVAAEGGGIRAAYWTASVLGEIQDQARQKGTNFANHVFAISGVSGGSLGAAVFDALLAADAVDAVSKSAPKLDCDKESCYRSRAQSILSEDFLAPTIAVMLFPDFLQRFSPIPFLDDRAIGLEEAWENAWDESENTGLFRDPFVRLWNGQVTGIPLLFLNSTVVETGQRIIVNPVYNQTNDEKFSDVFHNALNATSLIGEEIPLSTAVHMSARFTYVSPAGTIQRLDYEGKEESWIRVVDGGYFENSGAVTADEILTQVIAAAKFYKKSVIPIIIHISNEPQSEEKNFGENVALGEIGSPLRAIFNVRPARGYQARERLRDRVNDHSVEGQTAGRYFHFKLCESATQITLPLGWMLSYKARDEMNAQLIGARENNKTVCDTGNKKKVTEILKQLNKT